MNSALKEAHVFNKGEYLGFYRKIALFCDEKRGKHGEELKIFDINGLKVGLTICYDFYFPEYSRILTFMGADLIINVGGAYKKQEKMWESLVLARAIENQIFVVVSGFLRKNEKTGGSMIVSPDLKIIKKIDYGKEGLINTTLNLNNYKQFRNNPSPLINPTPLFKKGFWGPYLPDLNKKILFKYQKLYFEHMKVLKGVPACPGKFKGRVRVLNDLSEIKNFQEGEVFVGKTTNPLMTPALTKAGAILTQYGGSLSHAAIVSREFRIPCVVGINNLLDIVKTGDIVIVDGEKGEVKLIEL